MSRWLTARSGHWTKCPLHVAASYTTAPSIRPSFTISSYFHSSQPVQRSNKRISWDVWLRKHPFSIEEIQSVYDACVESRVFASTAERPIVLDGDLFIGPLKKVPRRHPAFIVDTFKATDGLKPKDWAARGLSFVSAVNIAIQLQVNNYFAEKNFSRLVKAWPQLVGKGEVDAAETEPAKGSATTERSTAEGRVATEAGMETEKRHREECKMSDLQPEASQTVPLSKQAEPTAHRVLKGGKKAENVENTQADQARRNLRQRKKAELASDAAEGIKSKRRPLRLAATSKGVPLTFQTMKNLHRVERRGREIVVDSEVKTRTKAASVELAQTESGYKMRGQATASNNLADQGDHYQDKERRSSAGLKKIKKLAEKPSEVLAAIIKDRTRSLDQTDLRKSRKKTHERQLERAKQALAYREWEARKAHRGSSGTGRGWE